MWERKYEIDSLCYPVLLAWKYREKNPGAPILDEEFHSALQSIVEVFSREQNHAGSPYWFVRRGCPPQDTLSHGGRGAPVAHTGMTWSGFRPSDDACTYGYLIPSNLFASVTLGRIGAFARELGQPSVVNFWMPDGTKDTCVDTRGFRERMTASLDEIFKGRAGMDIAPCALESKLFGVGVESFTVVSSEYSLGYAQSREIMACLDAGHYHPTEVVSAKITAVLAFIDRILLHVSRPVRWDSDHVVALDDELQRIMDEVVWNGYTDRVAVGLDFFDASINRVACWAIGMRNARKALLSAFLAPWKALREAEADGDDTRRLALYEERRTLPLGAVWNYYCETRGVPPDGAWLPKVTDYEKSVLSLR